MSGKKYRQITEKLEQGKKYSLQAACDLLPQMQVAKFDETIDVAVRLGVDPRQSDQVVRGAVSLPHGLGKKVRVLVLTKGEKVKEALGAGADYVGADEFIEKIQGGWLDFDRVVATPDMMVQVSKVAKILGPRGLMPNPKLGTVTLDVAKVVLETKAGRVDFRTDKAGVVHAPVGKVSFGSEKLKENIRVFLDVLMKLKPASSKGLYLRSVTLSSTMGPGIPLDLGAVFI